MKKYFWLWCLCAGTVWAQPSRSALPNAATAVTTAPLYAAVISKVPIIERTEKMSRLLGYRVTYEYEGKQYTMQTADDPGERVAIQLQTVPVITSPAVSVPLVLPTSHGSQPAASTAIVPPTQAQVDASLTPPPAPPVIVYPSPVYVAPPPVVYPPIIGIGIGIGWGHHGRWHGRW